MMPVSEPGNIPSPHVKPPLQADVQMFERETAREKNLEKAVKEAKNKARKEAGKAGEPEQALTDANLQQVQFTADKDHNSVLQRMMRSIPKHFVWQEISPWCQNEAKTPRND